MILEHTSQAHINPKIKSIYADSIWCIASAKYYFVHPSFHFTFMRALTDCCCRRCFLGTGGTGELGEQHSQCLCSCICASSRQDRNTSFIARGDLSFGKNHRVGKYSHRTIFICFFSARFLYTTFACLWNDINTDQSVLLACSISPLFGTKNAHHTRHI